MPSVPNQGGTVFAHPSVAVVTYADDPNRAAEESFVSFLMTSQWLSTVGREYGVSPGSASNVELTANAPGSIDDPGVASALQALSGAASGTLYVAFYPAKTTVTANGQALCSFASGYHLETQGGSPSLAYAVVPDCGAGLPALESSAAHELFEGLTDPFPLSSPAWLISDTSNPWHGLGGELADLCANVLPQWSEGGYSQIARIYSNQAAQAGGDPCLPAVGTYFGADVEPQSVPEVAEGNQQTFSVLGWSTGPVAAWELQAVFYGGTFTPTLDLSAQSLDNGGTATLTVGVPAGTASGDFALIQLGSVDPQNDQSSSFVGVAVP